MGIRADVGYNGTIRSGSRWIQSSQKGTPGFQVLLECEDGTADYIIWLTDKNRDRATTDFEALGVTPEQLADRYYLEHQLPVRIAGQELYFQTRTEEFNGQQRTKVSYIGKKREEPSALAASAARFFGSGGGGTGDDSPPPDYDDDLGF